MERIAKKNINTPAEFEKSLFGKYSEFDYKRWRLLLKRYKGYRFVDIGCYDSPLAAMAKNKYEAGETWALDFSPLIVEIHAQKHPDVNYVVGDVYNLPFKTKYFDYIVMGELIEHLEWPERAIAQAMNVLKPGGVLALSVPLEETKAGEVDNNRHLWSFNKQDLQNLLSPYGRVKIKIFKRYRFKYHHPTIIVWCKKYDYEQEKSQSFKKTIFGAIRTPGINVGIPPL